MIPGQPGRTGRRSPHPPRPGHRLPVRAHARALALTLLVVAAGCAIPVDSAARPVANPPSELGNTTSSSTTPNGLPDFSLELYFVNESDQLVRVRRPRSTLATAQDALSALANPTDEEVARFKSGLNSKLGPLVFRPAAAITADGVLEVKVDGEELRGFVDTAANRVNRIYAQIVCTLTVWNSDIHAVQIVDANGPIPVKVADAPETRPIGPGDFNKCATVPSPVTTTQPAPTTTADNPRQTPTSSSATPPASGSPA